MRRVAQHNFPAFCAAEAKLQAAGWNVINPARLAVSGILNDGTPATCRFYARRDLRIITDVLRAEHGDAVVILPGWGASRGARGEVAVARWCRLRVVGVDFACGGNTEDDNE